MISNSNIKSFIRDLPKVELHLHLEGAIPLQTLLQLIEKYKGKNYITLAALERKFEYKDFSHFIDTWYWKNSFICEYEDYEFIAEQVAKQLAAQNIRYAEVFFSPTDFRKAEALPQEIAIAIRKGLDKHSDKINIQLIADLVRDEENKLPQLEQITEVRDQGIIGIGLGGKEKEFPPNLFTEVFKKAKKIGFHTTCHAGEAAGPDYIWQALQNFNVERIGHGTSAIKDEKLIDYLIENQIPVEMCPISNIRTASVNSLANHPIYDFYKKGMLVSVNTDDPEMFNTTMDNEYLSLLDTFDFEIADIIKLEQNSIESAWCSDALKTKLSEELTSYFNNYLNV